MNTRLAAGPIVNLSVITFLHPIEFRKGKVIILLQLHIYFQV
jgi:hypothetical protein